MKQNGGSISILRGLMGAFVCALAGVTISVALLDLLAVCRWCASGGTGADWRYDMNWATNAMTSVIPGFVAVFGATGWATYAPRGSFRLARTLSIIFVVSLPLSFLVWYVAEWNGLVPQQSKADYTRVESAGTLILVVVPIPTAIVLTAVRLHGMKQHGRSELVPSVESSGAQ